MKNLREKSMKLTQYLGNLLKNGLGSNIEIITPPSINDRGCQLSLRLKTARSDIMAEMYAKGIIADWREPDVIRVAPVPLYNSYKDCYNFVNRLKGILIDP